MTNSPLAKYKTKLKLEKPTQNCKGLEFLNSSLKIVRGTNSKSKTLFDEIKTR